MLNVFVIEDHPVIVAGLKSLFHLSADGIKITGNAESVDNLIGRNDNVKIDLILLDLYLPGSLAGDNVKKLKSTFPGKPIVVYTSEDSDTWKKKMAAYGVNKSVRADRERLRRAINAASTVAFAEGYKQGSQAAEYSDTGRDLSMVGGQSVHG